MTIKPLLTTTEFAGDELHTALRYATARELVAFRDRYPRGSFGFQAAQAELDARDPRNRIRRSAVPA